jgi:superfamily II DNA or RNA helicase
MDLSFDRGTLRLSGPDALELPEVRWDPRTSCARAPAFAYGAIRRAARERGVALRDPLFPRVASRIVFESPPLRPYQAKAVQAWLDAGRRGIVAMPTGSGKTRVAIACVARAAVPTLVLCPTRALLAQWESEISGCFRGRVGLVGDGAFDLADVTIMTFESAYRHLDVLGDRFGCMIVDEVHHFASGLRQEALEMSIAPMRLGLSATLPPGSDDPGSRLSELVGPVVFELGLDELVGKFLADVDLVRIRTPLDPDEREEYETSYAPFARFCAALGPRGSWADLQRAASCTPGGRRAMAGFRRALEICALPRSKRRIVTQLLARHESDRALVFTAFASDARIVSRDNLIPLITSEIGRRERNEILERFRAGTYRAIVSARVLNEGLDVPDASVAIVAGSALGDREHVQRVGRVLRPAPGKRARVYELVAEGTVEERRSYARRRALAL